MSEVLINCHDELTALLPRRWRDGEFAYLYNGPQSVKHLIEAIGVPHPEVALILADGQPVGFDHQPADGSHIAIYPEGNGVVVDGAPALRPPLPEPVAFLTDNHLGRLTRFLRLLGFDTAYGGTAADDLLAERAHDENRVLLTRDRGLLKRSLVVFGYCPRSTDPREQLIAVLRRYRLFDQVAAWRRCLRCNGLLRPVAKAHVLDQLEPKTRLYYDEFQQCAACGQVYWRGSHFGELERLVMEVQLKVAAGLNPPHQEKQPMTSWTEFAQQAPELAAFGQARFQTGVAYLGTVRADGGPRVHPVTPIISQQLFLFMEPTSPKGKDLQRDSRYTLHCAVEDSGGGGGEFYVRGRATLTGDPALREQAVQAASYTPEEQYILFVLTVEFAFMNQYVEGGANSRRWQAAEVSA